MKNFQSLGIPSQFCDALTKLGITEPTQIQQEAIPAAVQGADILASSRTGSGKTIAYLLPLLINLEKSKDRTAIIILPTREVATQVADSLNKLLNFSRDFKHALLIGGARMDKQLQQLSRNPRILIGTPGRICDHLNRRSLSLDNTSFLVLDEVDRMLDFGFQDELNHIKKAITSPVQTLLFSATIPKEIEAMAGKYLSNPTRITVGCAVSPCADVEQATIHVNHAEKYETLVKELQARHESVIIFVKTKHGAAKLAKGLSTQNFDAQAIHGDLRQSQRDRVIAGFRRKDFSILVATDVVARGLDVVHVRHVINYDLPQCPEDYVHRIGRTGRAGEKGFSLSLISNEEKKLWYDIEVYMDPSKKKSLPKPGKSAGSSRSGKRSNSGRGFGAKREFGDKKSFGPRSNDSGFAPRERREDSSREGFKPRFAKEGGFGEDRPRFAKEGRSSEERPRFKRSEDGESPRGERRERSFGERSEFKPRGDRPAFARKFEGRGDREGFKPRFAKEGGFGEDRPRFKRSEDGESPRGERRERSFGERSEFKPRGDRPAFARKFEGRGDREGFKPRFAREGGFGEDRPRFNRSEDGEFPRGEGRERSFGERSEFKPRGERSGFAPRFGDKPKFGGNRFGGGFKRDSEERPQFGRPIKDGRKFEKKDFADKRPWTPFKKKTVYSETEV